MIDEAHRGIAPTYTKVLDWLERPDAPWALIGLTATPFRGWDEAETRRLVRRFGKRLLPDAREQAGLFREHQRKGYLARVEADVLEIPEPFAFDASELDVIEGFHGAHFPETALRRLAASAKRNVRIVERILAMPDHFKVLVFACTVRHAQELAARLNLRGRRAAAIEGSTRRSLRQQWIEEFLHGDLQVLVNFGVLTTGFDAPKVDAIVIARPTFSPVLYHQMVGRGLRGPLNGGKATCLLVDVVDNLVRYGDRLATYERLIRPWVDA